MHLFLQLGTWKWRGDTHRDCPSNLVDLFFSCLACGTVALEMHAGKGEILSVRSRGKNQLKIWCKAGGNCPSGFFLRLLQHWVWILQFAAGRKDTLPWQSQNKCYPERDTNNITAEFGGSSFCCSPHRLSLTGNGLQLEEASRVCRHLKNGATH